MCTCETQCTEDTVDKNCPICSADGADLSACLGMASAALLRSPRNGGVSIFIGGEELIGSADNPAYAYQDGGNLVAGDESNYNFKWDGSTLSLRSAKILVSNNDIGIRFKENSSLTIELFGPYNTIDTYGAVGLNCTGIDVEGDLTMKAGNNEGRLEIKSSIDGYNLDVAGKLTMESGTVVAGNMTRVLDGFVLNGGSFSAAGSISIMASKELIVNDGTLDAQGKGVGINVPYGTVAFNGGTVTIGGSMGIDAEGSNVSFGNSSVTINARGGCGVSAATASITGGNVTILTRSGGVGVFDLTGGDLKIQPSTDKEIVVETGNSEDDAKEIDGSPFASETSVDIDATYFHSEEIDAPVLYIGGVGFYSGKPEFAKTDNLGVVTKEGASSDDYTIQWDGDKTLTLNNANIVVANDKDGLTAGIYYCKKYYDLDINLIGMNTVAGPKTENNNSYGVYATSVCNITGDGTLMVTSGSITAATESYLKSAGICSGGDLTITDAKIVAMGGDITAAANVSLTSAGIYSGYDFGITDGSIYTTGGVVKTSDGERTGSSSGLFIAHDATITNSTVEVISKEASRSEAFSATGIFIEEGSKVTLTAGEGNYSYGTYCGSYVNVYDSEVTATSGETADSGTSRGIYAGYGLSVYGGEVTATSSVENGQAIWSEYGSSVTVVPPDGTLMTVETGKDAGSAAPVDGSPFASSEYGSRVSVGTEYFHCKTYTSTLITAQPDDVSVAEEESATFRVEAVGDNLTYQWQQRANIEDSWDNIAGATSDTYTIEKTTFAINGTQYRCEVTGDGGKAESNAATLTVNQKTTITTQPDDVTVTEEQFATFRVKATGTNVTYQWQQRANSEDSWKDITEATADTYTIEKTTLAMNGTQYRCEVTGDGGKVNSNAATLTVNQKTVITTQPDDVTVTEEETATFRVEATGANVTYQWQQRTDSGESWKDIAGANDDTYTIAKVKASMDGTQYRCEVTGDGGKVNSDAAALKVNLKTIITTQPTDIAVTEEQSAEFHVKATGTNVTYQWQQRVDSEDNWDNIDGATADTYTIEKTTFAMNGTQYRCEVTGDGGKAESNAATLTVNQKTIITTQPTNLTVVKEQSAAFRVEATGTNVTYQWQQRTDSGESWTDIDGATTDIYTIEKVSASMNGTQYRCVVTGAGGEVNSSAVTLTVNEEYVLTISAIAKDGNVIVSWEKPDGYDITGYELYVAEEDFAGSATPILIPDGDTITYTVENLPDGTALVNGKTYTFYLIALYAQDGGSGEIKSNEGTAIPNTLYLLTVENGGNGATVSGEYAAKNEVTIHAGTKENSVFLGWTASGDVTFADASSPDTTFIMPEENITITANWHTHSWSTEWSSDGTNHWHSCSGCKEKQDQAAHSFEWVIDQEATATQGGSKHEECTVCGYAKAKIEIPAAGQDGGSGQPSAGDNDSSPSGQSGVSGSAQTGDESVLSLWVVLLIMSVLGLCTMAFYRKKHCGKK